MVHLTIFFNPNRIWGNVERMYELWIFLLIDKMNRLVFMWKGAKEFEG